LLKEKNDAVHFKALKEAVARCLLYRVSPTFTTEGGYSGVALYANGPREDNTIGPGVLGFQSFVQKSDFIQPEIGADPQRIRVKLAAGRVAFYGAFPIPQKMRQNHVIV
jgi:hypothetical protein